MSKIVFITILILCFAKDVFGQSHCDTSINKLKYEIDVLQNTLNDGSTAYFYHIKDSINTFLKNIMDTCKINTLPQNIAFIKSKWQKLSKQLNKKTYISETAIVNISNNFNDFFSAVQTLKIISLSDSTKLIRQIDSIFKRDLHDTIQPLIKSVDFVNKKVDSAIEEVEQLSNLANSLRDTTKFIKSIVQSIDSILRNNVFDNRDFVTTGAFNDGLYSISYNRISKKDLLFPAVASIEILFPINSFNIYHFGIFGSGGFYYKRFVLQAGIGYLDRMEYHNIAWKGSIDFLGKDIGLGLAYSPLTGVGIRVAFRFK